MRVLVYTEAWGKGGIETFVSNEVRLLSSEATKFEVFSTWCWKGCKQRGLEHPFTPHKVVFVGFRPNLVRRTLVGYSEFSKELKHNNYDVVHINTMNGMGFLYAFAARRYGVPVRIAHAHNSDFGTGLRVIKGAMHSLGRALFMSSATNCLACSNSAGQYLFGTRKYEVIPNGVEIERYAFRERHRSEERAKLHVERSCMLIGSVGRLSSQKNPLFQLRVFRSVKEKIPSSRFLMVGSGELNSEVNEEIKRLGLGDSVIRLEAVDDVSSIYSALDLLLMPSLFEGLPMVAVEAQCAGLSILCSSAVTSEVEITDLVTRKELSDGADSWSKAAIDILSNMPHNREHYADLMEDAGYSVEAAVSRLQNIIEKGERG